MSGISCAHSFRDRNILLLERGELLSGATGNNAGFLITGFGEHFFRTAQRWGVERACEIQRIHLSSHQKIRELTNTVEQSGSYTLGWTEQEAGELRRSYELMLANGFQVEWVDAAPSGLRENKPALLNREDGLLDSSQFWKELAKTLPYKTNSRVLQVIDQQNSLCVITTAREFRTRRVVYCLNAFSSDLLPELEGRIIPLRAQMVELPLQAARPCPQPVMTAYGEIYWNFTPTTLRFGGLEYMVPDEEVGVATSLSAKVLDAQLRWIQQNLAGVSHSESPLRTWFGTMGFTVDGYPVVGKLPGKPNQYVLAGMCGLGHSYALTCSSWLYEQIVHDKDRIPHYFSSDRILNLPRYTGGNWRTLYEAWNH